MLNTKLSIIIPIYNRQDLVPKMVKSLKQFDLREIEIVVVDDGSIDYTFQQLEQGFKTFKEAKIKLVALEENSGPGGARNAGLNDCSGKYIWFCDSDDQFSIKAWDVLNSLEGDYDFIDFNYFTQGRIHNSMYCSEGYITVTPNNRLSLAEKFGRICTKIFLRDKIKNAAILYPENCIYEDNYLLFRLPLVIDTFYKSTECVYFHNETVESVTRVQKFNPKTFDRLLTSFEGYKYIKNRKLDKKIENVFRKKFVKLFFINTSRIFVRSILKGNINLIMHLIRITYIFINIRYFNKFVDSGISYYFLVNSKHWKRPIKFL